MKTDVLAALRRWRYRWPADTLVLGTAALGIAVFLALAAVVDSLLLRQPFGGAEGVVRIDRAARPGFLFTLKEIAQAGDETGLPLAAMARPQPLGRSPDAPLASWVSTNFFDVVGVPPLVGRTFGPGDDGPTDRAVIGERLWRARFGADPGVIGRSVLIGDRRLTVLGVVPTGFSVPLGATVWTSPFPDYVAYDAIARLSDGMDVGAISSRWPQWRAVPIRDFLAPRDASYAWILLASGGLLLAAAWAYFGVMQIGEASRRFGEMRVRLALGAGWWQAMRPIVVDASLRVVVCVVGGLLVAPGVLAWVVTRLPPDLVTGRTIAVDARMAVAVVAALCAAMAMLMALAVGFGLRTRSAGGGPDARLSRSGARWTRAAVAAQFAAVTPVIYLLGLSAHSFHALATRDLGYGTANVLSAQVPLWSGESTVGAAARYVAKLQPLLDRVGGIPGVRMAAFSDDRLGFVPTGGKIRIRLPGMPDVDAIVAQQDTVTGAYFRLLGIRQVAGEIFGERVRDDINWKDIYGGVVVDTTLAAALGRGDDVVGRRVIVGFSPTTIIGVVDPIRSRRPDELVEPRIYLRLSPNAPFATNLLVRFDGPAGPVARAVAAAVQQEMGAQAPADTVLLADELKRLQRPYRGLYELSMLMAWIAGVLSLSGMFGVATDLLARRRKEVAVRIAVGASGANILRVFLRDVTWAMPGGVAAGLAIALLLFRDAENRLYGVAPLDAATLVGAVLVMASVVLCGAAVPVRRLLRINVSDALRSD